MKLQRLLGAISIVFANGLVGAAALHAGPFPVMQIAESLTPAPDDGGVFKEFDPPVVRGDRLIFSGMAGEPPRPPGVGPPEKVLVDGKLVRPGKPDIRRLYEVDLGGTDRSLRILFEGSEIRPDGLPDGGQLHAHTPWMDGDDYAFAATYNNPQLYVWFEAIYANIDGQLHLCADRSNVYPGEVAAVGKREPRKVVYSHPGPARQVELHNKAVYFRCFSDLTQSRNRWGVYRWQDGEMSVVADGQHVYPQEKSELTSPTGGENIPNIESFLHAGDNTWLDCKTKFYRCDGSGNRELVLDARQQFPNSRVNSILGVKDGRLMVQMEGWMYWAQPGELKPVIAREAIQSPNPGGEPALTEQLNCSVFGDGMAFVVHGRGAGIHAVHNGKLVRVIGREDKIGEHEIKEFHLGPQAYDGNRIAFHCVYGGTAHRRTGVFVAQLGPRRAAGGNASKPDTVRFRRWTSADGRFEILARLIRINGDSVVLRTREGREVTVPTAKLSDKDVKFIDAQ